jgi:anti-sigma regulatory factor (Ser/Thr protein kinase)
MSLSTSPEHHGDAPVLRLDLRQDPEAPALARAAITALCAESDIDATTVATVTLLVSEIVTNAVIHPDVKQPSTIGLLARIAQGAIRVEVTDRGAGFTPRPRDPARVGGGYGLYLLDKVAARWGVETGPGTTVWFDVATA